MVIHPHVLGQQRLKACTALEVMRAQHLTDAPVETLHHAVHLWSSGRDQAVGDFKLGTGAIKGVLAAGLAVFLAKAIRELCAIPCRSTRPRRHRDADQ